MPFIKAKIGDPYFNLLYYRKWEQFWTVHEKNINFSNEFKELIQGMLTYEPSERLNLDEVENHSWFNGPMLEGQDLKEAMTSLKSRAWSQSEIYFLY